MCAKYFCRNKRIKKKVKEEEKKLNKMCSFGDSFVAAKIEVIEFVHIFTITNLLIEAEALSEESPICSSRKSQCAIVAEKPGAINAN